MPLECEMKRKNDDGYPISSSAFGTLGSFAAIRLELDQTYMIWVEKTFFKINKLKCLFCSLGKTKGRKRKGEFL